MAQVRDPNWAGPGPGPFIEVPDDKPDNKPDNKPSSSFTPEELASINEAAYSAAGYSGDTATANYIRQLQAGELGNAADTQAALNRLIAEGKARNLAERGNENYYPGYDPGGREEDSSSVDEFMPALNAKEILRTVLSTYGLEDLYEYAYSLYAKQQIDVTDGDSFIYALREQDVYKKRFAANERRRALGFKELSPATYIALEKSYKDTMAANGLPQGFYDSSEDFEKLIGGDVSVAELNSRLKDAYSVVRDASPEVKNKMAEMYGVTDGDLLAYVIDPDRARELMAPDYKRQAQAALIAESAQRLSGLKFNKDIAEQFVRQGVTQAEAEAAFTTVGQMGELRRAGLGEQQISDVQFAQAALGTDAEAKRLVEERKRRRIGEVTASGGSATLAQGDSTSYKSGYGQANL